MEIIWILALAFPTVANIIIVAQEDEQSALGVKETAKMWAFIASRSVVLISAAAAPVANTWNLWLLFQPIHDAENLVLQRKLLR